MSDTRFCHGGHQSRFEASAKYVGFMVYGSLGQRTIDLVHEEADRDRKLECPLLALWGEKGVVERLYEVPKVWREYASNVHRYALAAGHFLAEESSQETAKELISFLEA